MKGYIQVYTGNGKGKTTAAFGLALRAAGAGMKVFIAQFVKGQEYSEIFAVREFLPSVTIKQYGFRSHLFIHRTIFDTIKIFANEVQFKLSLA